MAQNYFLKGYGLTNVEDLLSQETNDKIDEGIYLFDMVDEIDTESCPIYWCYGEDIGDTFYISMNYPWEKPFFESREDCNKYIYNHIKHLLDEKIKYEELEFDEFCDYEYC